jgi:hypothetical protein
MARRMLFQPAEVPMHKGVFVGVFVAFLGLASVARADAVNISVVDFPTGIIGPYVMNVGGEIQNVICDDYISETYWGESWTANVSTLFDVSQTKFKDLSGYEEIAWLATQMTDPANSGSLPAIQYALWEIFEAPTPFNDINWQLLTDAQSWLKQAQTLLPTFTPEMFTNVLIYTATGTPTCGGGSCPPGPDTPQEFIHVPEAGTLEMLTLGFFAALAYGWSRRNQLGVAAVETV